LYDFYASTLLPWQRVNKTAINSTKKYTFYQEMDLSFLLVSTFFYKNTQHLNSLFDLMPPWCRQS